MICRAARNLLSLPLLSLLLVMPSARGTIGPQGGAESFAGIYPPTLDGELITFPHPGLPGWEELREGGLAADDGAHADTLEGPPSSHPLLDSARMEGTTPQPSSRLAIVKHAAGSWTLLGPAVERPDTRFNLFLALDAPPEGYQAEVGVHLPQLDESDIFFAFLPGTADLTLVVEQAISASGEREVQHLGSGPDDGDDYEPGRWLKLEIRIDTRSSQPLALFFVDNVQVGAAVALDPGSAAGTETRRLMLALPAGCTTTADGDPSLFVDDAYVEPEPASGSDPLWPRLNANLFSPINTGDPSYRALGAFDSVTTGGRFTAGCKGGTDYGTYPGYGSHLGESYDLSCPGTDQKQIHGAKQYNPDQRWVMHLSLRQEEHGTMTAPATNPRGWFGQQLSPRWLAFTPLAVLTEDQQDKNSREFHFRPEDVARWVSWGVTGYGENWTPGNKYNWYYLAFFDNDKGGGRGTLEIMALSSLDPASGVVTVATNMTNLRRHIAGTRQTYRAGHRAGILSSALEAQGSLVFMMNRTRFCPEVDAWEPVDDETPLYSWADARREFMREFYLPSRYPVGESDEVAICDGIIMDADEETPGAFFRLARTGEGGDFRLDYDLDGTVDGDLDGDDVPDDLSEVTTWIVDGYQRFEEGLRFDVVEAGRPDFLLVKNGPITDFPRELNGRRWEDLNGGFQEHTEKAAVENYVESGKPGHLHRPLMLAINERDREMPDDINYPAHRRTLAETLIFGDGQYGHTGDHALRHEQINGLTLNDGRDDWMDEFSVDQAGVSGNRTEYAGDYREQFHDWMGLPLEPARELDAGLRLWRRHFDNALVLYSYRSTTVDLGQSYQKILGLDPFNDGTVLSQIVLDDEGGAGAVLVRTEPLTAGEASDPAWGDAPLSVTDYDPLTGELRIHFHPACAATGHAAYWGDLASVAEYAYSGGDCSLGTSGEAVIDPGAGSVFFLIVGTNDDSEGSYGQDSGGAQRPEAAGIGNCDLPQQLSTACR